MTTGTDSHRLALIHTRLLAGLIVNGVFPDHFMDCRLSRQFWAGFPAP